VCSSPGKSPPIYPWWRGWSHVSATCRSSASSSTTRANPIVSVIAVRPSTPPNMTSWWRSAPKLCVICSPGRCRAARLRHGSQPENVVAAEDKLFCGVSLNIPVNAQLAAIRRHFPAVAQLGVLFDPENNRTWFEDAKDVAASMGLELVPLRVNRQSGKLDIVGDFSKLGAILFIPDKSIISKAVIQHVIKEAVLHRIPWSATTSSFTTPARRSTSSSIIPRSAAGRRAGPEAAGR